MKKLFLFLAISLCATQALARDEIRIVGSTTLYPLVTIAAENFGRQGKFHTPVVESTGTGGGLKLFCSGVGENYPDIANASRKIKPTEEKQCKDNKVPSVMEIKLGSDGIVLANAVSGPKYQLSLEQIFQALARQVPKDGKLIDNPYTMWNEIDAKLPKEKIVIYGPPPTDGTRDSFSEMVLQKSCENLLEFKAAYKDEKARQKTCKLIREDGKYIEIGSNYNLIIQKLQSQPGALGIFGYNYLEENGSKVKGAEIGGSLPDFEQISGGKYPLARPLYIYVKSEDGKFAAGLREFLLEIVSEKAIGDEGYLVEKGLIPLKKPDFESARAMVTALPKATAK